LSDMPQSASQIDFAAPDLEESIRQELRSLQVLSDILKSSADLATRVQNAESAQQQGQDSDSMRKGDSDQTCQSQCNTVLGFQEGCSPATTDKSPRSFFRGLSESSLLKPGYLRRSSEKRSSLTSTLFGNTLSRAKFSANTTLSSRSLFGNDPAEESTYTLLLALEEAIYQSVMSQASQNPYNKVMSPTPEDYTHTQKVQLNPPFLLQK
jgi:hypothetical protein